MKKFLIFAAIFAAMFLIMSCGGSSSVGGDGYTQDGGKVCTEYGNGGECKGHEVRACVENENAWYEVSDINKKFECDGMDCTQAAIDLNNYCYDTDIDYDDEDGVTCVTTSEPDTCGGKAVKTCTKDNSYWYEVDGKKFECKEPDSEECTQALLDYTKYCSEAEESAEGNEGGESTFATEPTAYLPQSHAGKIVEAWYMLKEADEDKIKIEAVFLFQDFSLVVTSAKVYSIADGRDPEDEIIAEGTFEITSGSYNDGSASVDTGEAQFDVTITNGVLSAMGEEFIKQDNGYVPEPR